jgi:hypothetical protein
MTEWVRKGSAPNNKLTREEILKMTVATLKKELKLRNVATSPKAVKVDMLNALLGHFKLEEGIHNAAKPRQHKTFH